MMKYVLTHASGSGLGFVHREKGRGDNFGFRSVSVLHEPVHVAVIRVPETNGRFDQGKILHVIQVITRYICNQSGWPKISGFQCTCEASWSSVLCT